MSWMKLTSEIQDMADLERASHVATGIDLDDMDHERAAAILLGTVLQWHTIGGWHNEIEDEASAVETLSRVFQRSSSGGNGWHGTVPLPEWFGPLTVLKIALLRVEAGDDGGRMARDLSRATGLPIRYCKYHRFDHANRFPPAHKWSKKIILPDGGKRIDILYSRKDGKLAGPWYPSGWLL